MKTSTKFLDYFISILENTYCGRKKRCVWRDDFHDEPLIKISIGYECAEDIIKEFKEIKEILQK